MTVYNWFQPQKTILWSCKYQIIVVLCFFSVA